MNNKFLSAANHISAAVVYSITKHEFRNFICKNVLVSFDGMAVINFGG